MNVSTHGECKMIHDRRTFLLQLGVLLGAAVPGRLVAAAGTGQASSRFRWRQRDPRTWIVERGGGNTTVLVERGGVVVVDAKVGGMGNALAREIKSRFGNVQALIITHHHGDHSGGINAFPGARIIAHRNAGPRLQSRSTQLIEAARTARQRLIDGTLASLARDFEVTRSAPVEAEIAAFADSLASATPPRLVADELLDDEQELRFGDSTFLVMHHGPGHTDNDVAILDPRRKLVVAGDLLFNRHHPFIDVSAGATTTGWQAFIEAIARKAAPDSRVIAGHGPDTDLAGLRSQSAYFDRVRTLARAARTEGRSREQFLETPNRDFAAFGFAEGWKDNLGVLFDETA
jgi:glyoxylase-like metal-dependent hydrolase (beta-lactamase superfamily II)